MRTPIGKTRQPPAPPGAATLQQGIQASRGVLGVAAAEKPDVSRWPPPPELAHCIAYSWMVRWDLTGQPPRLQETAPHPNVYLVFDHDRLEVSGVSTRKFSRTLESKGRAFGVKFRPGGFRPFLTQPVSRLTDRILPAREIFGPQADHLEFTLIRTTDDREILSHVHSFLIERVPPQDRSIDTAASLVELILATPEIKTVDDLSRRSAMNKRSLQRLFNEYVGVPPSGSSAAIACTS